MQNKEINKERECSLLSCNLNSDVMKPLLSFLLLAIVFITGCDTPVPSKKVDLASIPLFEASFSVYEIDSMKTLNPRNIVCWRDYVIIIESKNEPYFSFWSQDSLIYIFSDGYRGGGPNELIDARPDYFAKTDSSFFILDSQIERELILKGNKIQIINNQPLIFPDAINRLVRVDKDVYIMAGLTNGIDKAEHTKCTPDGNRSFGEYPTKGIDDGIQQFFFDTKFTAGKMGEKTIWDFYFYHNLIRQYSIDGELLQEVSLDLKEEHENTVSMLSSDRIIEYWNRVVVEGDYIYVLFHNKEHRSKDAPELQKWDWDGNLIARYQLDKYYNHYAISDKGILYAMDVFDHPYEVYTYNLNK